MGVDLGKAMQAKPIAIGDLAGRRIAIDAFNALYQFITIIRQPDGTPLKDAGGRITSHLSGLFYRTSRFVEAGMKPCYVFDGEPPEFKRGTVKERHDRRAEAKGRYEKALREGKDEEARKYAQLSATVDEGIIDESKKLLEAMGIPFVQAPSEGEAQASHMALKGTVWAAASQDYDSLLFGSPLLVRNLAIAGRRKLPRKLQYVDIVPEMIDLEESLRGEGITRKQLIIMGLMIGTDYNDGIMGIGPKKALELAKKHGDAAVSQVDWGGQDYGKLMEFFLSPPTIEVKELEWGSPQREKLARLLCDEHGFSEERIGNAIERMEKSGKGQQKRLDGWMK